VTPADAARRIKELGDLIARRQLTQPRKVGNELIRLAQLIQEVEAKRANDKR
jgi:hypothetical protein